MLQGVHASCLERLIKFIGSAVWIDRNALFFFSAQLRFDFETVMVAFFTIEFAGRVICHSDSFKQLKKFLLCKRDEFLMKFYLILWLTEKDLSTDHVCLASGISTARNNRYSLHSALLHRARFDKGDGMMDFFKPRRLSSCYYELTVNITLVGVLLVDCFLPIHHPQAVSPAARVQDIQVLLEIGRASCRERVL